MFATAMGDRVGYALPSSCNLNSAGRPRQVLATGAALFSQAPEVPKPSIGMPLLKIERTPLKSECSSLRRLFRSEPAGFPFDDLVLPLTLFLHCPLLSKKQRGPRWGPRLKCLLWKRDDCLNTKMRKQKQTDIEVFLG